MPAPIGTRIMHNCAVGTHSQEHQTAYDDYADRPVDTGKNFAEAAIGKSNPRQ